MSGISLSVGTKQHAHSERGDDLYETPPVAIEALLAHADVPKHVWEPACGPGAIVRALEATGRTVYATDIRDYGLGNMAQDFLMAEVSLCDCIVTNPPYKDAQAFVQKARELCPRVFMLLRLAFLESERRRIILDSGDLAKVMVFRKRLPMMHRDGWEGPKASSAIAFAWFEWDRNHSGPTQLIRI